MTTTTTAGTGKNDIYHIGAPVYVPERRSQLPRLLRESLGAAAPELIQALKIFVEEGIGDS